MAKMTKTEEISYDVVEEYAVIAESEDGLRKKEINLVSWNQNEAKVDMRWWTYNEDGERVKCNKGVTLTLEELENIVSVALDNGLVDYTPSESDDEEDYDVKNPKMMRMMTLNMMTKKKSMKKMKKIMMRKNPKMMTKKKSMKKIMMRKMNNL